MEGGQGRRQRLSLEGARLERSDEVTSLIAPAGRGVHERGE